MRRRLIFLFPAAFTLLVLALPATVLAQVSGGLPGEAHDMHFTSADVGWITTATAVFKTSDGGQSWRKQLSLRHGAGPSIWAELFFASARVGWVVGSDDGGRCSVWATTDGGAHWKARRDPPGWGLELATVGNSVLWTTATMGDQAAGFRVLRSLDAGRSWSVRRTFKDTPTQALRPTCVAPLTAARVLVGSGSGVLLTDNGGATWKRVSMRVGVVRAGCAVAKKVAWVAGQRGAARTTDGGRTWSVMLRADNLSAIQFVGAECGWAFSVENEAMLRTTDGGETWRQLAYPPWSQYSVQYPVNFLNPLLGLALDRADNIIWRTRDGGDTWDEL